MQLSGADYLKSLRDGRKIYLGGEQIDDVTTHPAFRNAAHSFAMIYDLLKDPVNREMLTYKEDGERHALYWMMPRSSEDLTRRLRCHQYIAEQTYGMMGRTQDFYAGFIVALAMHPKIFDTHEYKFSQNVVAYYNRLRDGDLFVCNAVTPPPGIRQRESFIQRGKTLPALRVVRENDSGVIVNGVKMLATAAPFAHEIWLGNIQRLAPEFKREAITCGIPINTPGLSLWSRKSFEKHAVSEFDNPLSYRYDESDCIVVCENVHIPWERVFVYDNADLSVDIYYNTAAHSMGNHQATVRYHSKLRFLAGIARRITEVSGSINIPAVQDTLGHIAAMESMIAAMVQGQVHDFEKLPGGYVNINRRLMYGAIYWCYTHYDELCTTLRELMGGGTMQMPSDVSVLENPELRKKFETYWSTPEHNAEHRFKLFKAAWDAVGSEFAGRHMLYERFYIGPAFIARMHAYREADWESMCGMTDKLLASYPTP
ncbi:MAG: hypothetical protein CMM54_00845 [Rhodospirillaceae bacterium]|nr:hypothetical protein [Rhodospirillaceae bacterium]